MAEESKAPRVVTESMDGCLVVHLKTKVLEDRDLNEVTDLIAPASPNAGVKAIVLDLAQVQFMPSLALGVLMKWNEACKRREQELRLAGIVPQVRDVFRITRLDRVLHLHDSVEQAAH